MIFTYIASYLFLLDVPISNNNARGSSSDSGAIIGAVVRRVILLLMIIVVLCIVILCMRKCHRKGTFPIKRTRIYFIMQK